MEIYLSMEWHNDSIYRPYVSVINSQVTEQDENEAIIQLSGNTTLQDQQFIPLHNHWFSLPFNSMNDIHFHTYFSSQLPINWNKIQKQTGLLWFDNEQIDSLEREKFL